MDTGESQKDNFSQTSPSEKSEQEAKAEDKLKQNRQSSPPSMNLTINATNSVTVIINSGNAADEVPPPIKFNGDP